MLASTMPFGFAVVPLVKKNDPRIVGFDRLRGAVGRCGSHEIIPPEIAAFLHLDGIAGAAHDDDRLDGGEPLDGFVDFLLQGHPFSSAEGPILRHDDFRVVAFEAVSERPRRKTGEDRVEERTEPVARQHGDRRLREVRCEDGDRVAFLHAESLEHVRELADFRGELAVSKSTREPVLALPDESRLLAETSRDVAIEQVDRGIADAADEVAKVRETAVEHFFPGLHPFQLTCDAVPETLRVFPGAPQHRLELIQPAARGCRGARGVGRVGAAVLNHPKLITRRCRHVGPPAKHQCGWSSVLPARRKGLPALNQVPGTRFQGVLSAGRMNLENEFP
jgi:hypothetical protein